MDARAPASDAPASHLAPPPHRWTWLRPLLATILLQTTSAFLSRLTPTLGPAISAALDVSEGAVGTFAAVGTLGSILFLVGGTPILRRFGPIRALQMGMALAVMGLASLLWPTMATVAVGSFLIGLGYGPSAPAGSDVLQRYAPPQHRNLIFSIKQAGVPVGGVVAGLTLPQLYEWGGFAAALAFSIGVSALTILLVQPLRGAIDAGRDPTTDIGPRALFSPRSLTAPLRMALATPGLVWVCAAGACFAVGQGCWFAFLVTFLVEGLDYSLVAAGAAFATMQATGIFGRIVLGGLSDRLGGPTVLRVMGIASGLTSLTMGFATAHWPLWVILVIAGIGGVTVSSWNGVQIAEVARRAPKGRISEGSAGATVLVFVGYVVGPLAFTGILAATHGDFRLCFIMVAVTSGMATLALSRLRHVDRATSSRL